MYYCFLCMAMYDMQWVAIVSQERGFNAPFVIFEISKKLE